MDGYNRYIRWKPVESKQRILQIYSKGLEYALVSQDYEQCHPFVWCKDFLHDVIYSTLNGKPFELYKFRYNPVLDPNPCLDKVRLLIANSKDRKFESKIPGVLDFLNQIEMMLKIKQSFVRRCWAPPAGYEKSGVFLIEGSKRWIQSPPMLSLYSLLIRVGFSHTLGTPYFATIEGVKNGTLKPYQKKDSYWLTSTEPALHKIFRIGDRKIFHKDMVANYPSNMSIDYVHNRLGIVGFATDIIHNVVGQPVLVPYWHYQK